MKNEKVVVTVSVTGSISDRSGNPALPVSPREIAESALDAHAAGASVAHIHVRDPDTEKPSMELQLYEEVVARIRDQSSMIINLTTGAGARFLPNDEDPIGPGPESTLCRPLKRIEHVLRLQPEICSLDVGSMNFGPHVFVNYLPHVEWMAEQAAQAGVKPELEVFDMGHIEIAKHLVDSGKVLSPPLFQLCMGTRWGIPAEPEYMMMMAKALPDKALWAGFGVGASSFPMLAQSVILGGNIRIGFEDTTYIERGRLAKSNRELVEKAVDILGSLGKMPATVDESRELIGLAV